MSGSRVLITGADGQLGRALQDVYPDAQKTGRAELDITSHDAVKRFDWDDIKIIINAAGYTDVDGAETEEGQAEAWAINDQGVGNLANISAEKDILFVNISSDYVFDGMKGPHKEDEPFSPLSVYGKTKAAGDQKASSLSRYYIIRTSWVIGDGKNFVRTMLELGQKGIPPTVVADQIGRPTFTNQLASAIKYLTDNGADYGTYNVTNEGEPVSWADFTRAIFEEAGFSQPVLDTTTQEYFANKPDSAPRPLNSLLDLTKIESTGFKPSDWRDDLREYIKKEMQK